MIRFCAVLGHNDPNEELVRMGAHPVRTGPTCALGTLLPWTHEGRECHSAAVAPEGRSQGSGDTRVLEAVGAVTLYNRDEIAGLVAREAVTVPPDCTDGQLLLCLYACAGVDSLAMVRGMFALAVWDGASLALITDPVGSRAIFTAWADGYRAASSSLRALRNWPRLTPRINLSAVGSFLSLAYLPGDQTLIQGVRRLPPACCLHLYPDGTSDQRTYWEPTEGPWNPADPPEAFAGWLRELLEQATEDCLPRNQDVGVFLSGGLDSSLVTALAAEIHDRRVRTYTINFGADLPNELSYAGLVANHCGTQHRTLTFSGDEVASHFAETVSRMDCPVGEGLTAPNLLLGRAAAEDGLSVILNGEGGDPCFGGPKNIPMLMFEFHRRDPNPTARARAYLRAHRHCYDDLPVLLMPEVLRALRDAPPLETVLQPYLESDRMPSFLNKLMFANLRLKGPGYMLAKVEFLIGSCGLEGRYPLFDRRIVDYSFAIPPRYKLFGTTEKFVLKLAVQDLLPEEIVDRPKSGMRMPMHHWLTGPLRDLAAGLLLDPICRSRGLFREDMLRAWLGGDGLLFRRHGQRLWLVMTLEAWLRSYVDNLEITPYRPSRRRMWGLFPIHLPGTRRGEQSPSATVHGNTSL